MTLLVAFKLLATALVLAGTVYALSRHAQRSGRVGGRTGLRVTSRTGVTKGAVIAVLEVDGRRFLVGAGEQQVTLLTELEAVTDEIEEDDHPTEPAMARIIDFARRANAVRLHRTGAQGMGSDVRPGIGLLDRMRAMTVRAPIDRPIRDPQHLP